MKYFRFFAKILKFFLNCKPKFFILQARWMEKGVLSKFNYKLILAIERNDQRAFRAFFDQYYPKLVQFALLYLPTYQAAEEVVSDVLYKILKNPQLLADVRELDSYLFLSVKNQSLTYLKSKPKFNQNNNPGRCC